MQYHIHVSKWPLLMCRSIISCMSLSYTQTPFLARHSQEWEDGSACGCASARGRGRCNSTRSAREGNGPLPWTMETFMQNLQSLTHLMNLNWRLALILCWSHSANDRGTISECCHILSLQGTPMCFVSLLICIGVLCVLFSARDEDLKWFKGRLSCSESGWPHKLNGVGP